MTRKEQETLFEKCRTYRRFLQKPLPEGLLSYLVGIAHKRSCGRNGQVLSFYAAVSSKALAALLPHLHWAAALPKEIGTPQKEEEPVALIFLVRPKDASPISLIDAGIAVDSMAYCAMCEGAGRQSSLPLIGQLSRGFWALKRIRRSFFVLPLAIQPTRAPWSLYRKAEPLIIMWMKKGIILFPKRTCPMS